MPNRNQPPYESSFSKFYSQVQQLCDSTLGQSLYDVRTIESSDDAELLYKAMNKLHAAVRKVRSDHGSQGPNTPWNPVFAQGAGAQMPPTPPDTPPTHRRNSDLKSDIEKLNKEINRLEKKSAKLDETRQELSKANENVETLANALASEYEVNKHYRSAAEQYEFLSKIKEKDMRQKKLKKDDDGARVAEHEYLKYLHLQGKMWLQAAKFDKAEHALCQVLERKKVLLGDSRLRRQENRDTQLLLCTALRSQNSTSKLNKAEEFYYHASLLTHLDTQNTADRTWAIRNAFELAAVHIEQGSYEGVIDGLGGVWAARHQASSECKSYLEKEIVRLWQLLGRRQQNNLATRVLKMCSDDSGGLPQSFLPHVREIGKLAYEQGQYETTILYLKKAWADASEPEKDRLQTGWLLAWSFCHLRQYPKAQTVLAALLNHASSTTSPSKLEVTALLAHVYLHLKKYTEAEKHARIVYNQCGASTLLSSHAYNHADILIRALIAYDQKEKYQDAHGVWNRIFAGRDRTLAQSQGKKALRHHADVGKELSAAWAKNIKARPNGAAHPKKPAEISAEVKVLEKMIAG
ncbi:uncharacterized protein KY384_000835 [Bacidia gigantensis]|uniref:uncharacterized protein n=1 Tax=Bacidia gigantensis TaxID=2732470 RepID=UPI001D042FFD|nr:uncharacterized protein KY384_000835 [Bacidia gigantensis]KAG8533993.1 hypothetical protein KY384_000835 [Bacidia gigantensis]